VDAQENAFRNPHGDVTAFVPLFPKSPLQDAVLVFKHAADGLFAQTPHLPDFSDGIVALESERLLNRALNWLFGE